MHQGRPQLADQIPRDCEPSARTEAIYIAETTSRAISYPANTAVPKPAATKRTMNAAVTA
jgi:hypothetical protein